MRCIQCRQDGVILQCVSCRTLAYEGDLAMAENIPKTDSLCYCVLIVIEVTKSADCDWEIPETKVLQECKKIAN